MSVVGKDGRFIANVIGGQRDTEELVRLLRDFQDPDSLFKLITSAIDSDPSRARLRGIARSLQKWIERNQAGGDR